ncbi:MAPEG family protein [Arenicella xantha]|uniref:Glutathione S-transferase n=1 Tax=Arenicella xantha TaxID=644221 RepID=A0A395JL65_9GAMM|nr:MAPEG family protein [Arenicella xantha]RBP51533.1 glutathione S-transferase [Arenicella xantha]
MTTNSIAIISVLMLAQYFFFTMRAGLARGKDKVVAPAMTGDEAFEKRLRVQLNTLEQMAIALPAMWLCATYFRVDVAAVAGLVYLIGRFLYSIGYLSASASKRGPGMGLTMLSSIVMLGGTLFGAIRALI